MEYFDTIFFLSTLIWKVKCETEQKKRMAKIRLVSNFTQTVLYIPRDKFVTKAGKSFIFEM